MSIDINEREVRVAADENAREPWGKAFLFDQAYGSVSQEALYRNCVEPLVHDVHSGYNATIVCYGQTGSGKTYTIEGPEQQSTLTQITAQRGILPRIFQTLLAQSSQPTLRFAQIEIYNESVLDVLDENRAPKIREHGGQVFFEDLTWVQISKMDDFYRFCKFEQRTARDKLHSSHCITICQVVRKRTCGTMYIVDCAGSEKLSYERESSHQRLETRHINRSLASLGNVVNALIERREHVPYRDSKLTRCLQEALGGNAKTLIILNVVKDAEHSYETRCTLRFGERARSITNYVTINRTPAKAGAV